MIELPKDLGVCILRDFTVEDAEASAAMEYDSDVKRYVGDGIMKRTREQYIEQFPNKLDLMGYAIQAKDGRLAGRASLDQSFVPQEPNIAIVLSRDFQGIGFGRAVAHCILSDWFCDVRGVAVRAEVHSDNSASLALLKSLGFVQTSERNEIGHDIYRLGRAKFKS